MKILNKKINRKILVSIWIFINALAIVLFLTKERASIQTDMISIVPRLASSRDFEAPIRQFFTASSSTINIFIESDNFEAAYQKYIELQEYIKTNNPQIELSSGYDEANIMEFFDKYKYHFLASNIRKELSNGNSEGVLQTALMNIFSPFSSAAFVDIENDPFLLSHHKGMEIINLMQMGYSNLEMRDDILVASYKDESGDDYKESIFVTLKIDSDNADTFLKDFLPFVESLKTSKSIDENNIEIYMAGIPLHSYHSKKMAQRDIFIISTLSLLFIFVLFFKTFGSVKPYIVSILTILCSSAFAYFMSSALFDSIHIFTFVFGTSLIGITIDYSIHFLGDYIHERDSNKTLANVAKPIIIASLTTIISYVFLSFCSVSILKTLSAFSIFGMLNTVLSVLIIYPIICKRGNMGRLNVKMAAAMEAILSQYEKLKSYYKWGFVIAGVLSLALIYMLGIKYDFSTNALYKMPDELEKNEIAVAKRLGHDNVSKMIFVRGTSVDDILAVEEDILSLLEGYNVLSISSVVPSRQRQNENFALVENALLPHLETHLQTLGFNNNNNDNNNITQAIRNNFEKAKNTTLDIEAIQTSFLADIVSPRVIYSNGLYYLAMMIKINTNINIDEKEQSEEQNNEDILNTITERYGDDIVLFNLSQEINASLALAMGEAIKFTALAYALIFALMVMLYRRRSVVIIALQLLSLMFTLVAHVVLGIEINMFSVLAIILSLGISIDYILFFIKQNENENNEKKSVVFISIMLSMLTTILSFSTLSFSSFVPVRSFGLSLLFGVVFSFMLSPIVNVYFKK